MLFKREDGTVSVISLRLARTGGDLIGPVEDGLDAVSVEGRGHAPQGEEALTVGMELATPQATPERMATSRTCPIFTWLRTSARPGLSATHEHAVIRRNTVQIPKHHAGSFCNKASG